jgi:hypothetical protein
MSDSHLWPDTWRHNERVVISSCNGVSWRRGTRLHYRLEPQTVEKALVPAVGMTGAVYTCFRMLVIWRGTEAWRAQTWRNHGEIEAGDEHNLAAGISRVGSGLERGQRDSSHGIEWVDSVRLVRRLGESCKFSGDASSLFFPSLLCHLPCLGSLGPLDGSLPASPFPYTTPTQRLISTSQRDPPELCHRH